jgi:type II secretion system protein L
MVQLRHYRDKMYLERVHVQQIPNSTSVKEDSPTDLGVAIRAAMTKEGFDTHASVVVAMPYGKVFFHNFRTDLSNNKDAQRLLKFELEDDFPIPFDDLVVDICGNREFKQDSQEFLVGAVSRLELQEWIKMLLQAGVECSVVSADVCALHKVAALNHKMVNDTASLIVYVDSCRGILAVSKGNKLICARYFNYINRIEEFVPALRREIELTLRGIFIHAPASPDASRGSGSDIPVPSRILLSGTNEIVRKLSEELPKEIDSEIVTLNPFSQISCSPQQQRDGELVIALGLALIGENKNGEMLDFLAADTVKSDQKQKTKRSALVFGSLLLAIGALLLVNIFIQLNALENENQRFRQEIRDIFIQTFPEEKKIVNELAQMTEKYEALKAEYSTIATEIHGRAPSLRILQHISEKITPDQNVNVSSTSITAESVRLSGTAPSFESVEKVVGVLSQISEFESVELRNIDIEPTSGKVRFNLSIKMRLN